MFVVTPGLIVPSFGSMANRTVHLKAVALAEDLGSCGSVSSERYSSSPLMRTTWLALAGTVATLVDDPRLVGGAGQGGEQASAARAAIVRIVFTGVPRVVTR